MISALLKKNPFVLAPLAGYTDLPFRLLCREYGAGLVCSEMISSHGLVYRQQQTHDMAKTTETERPVSMQLFGGEPEIMAEAAAILSEYNVDIIDINMGCPVRKVIKKGAGAALMKNPRLAGEIISRVRANSRLPVTVKIRLGWNHQEKNGAEFAGMAEDHGAQAITVHGRTWTDGFSGEVDWAMIGMIKKAVTVPIIGNGDILNYQQGLEMMEKTGCDGVMIGRAALGCPWIFQPRNPDVSLNFRLKALNRHLELIKIFGTPDWGLAGIKNISGKYFKGLPHGAAIRERIYRAESFAKLQELISRMRLDVKQ